jgi:bifunctional non-homologous end joining protein LigD
MEKESKKSSGNFDLKVGKITLHLTNQDKIYFPDDNITKGDIVNYYREIADIMLPYLKDRPQSMNRFPNGIKGPGFFQKDVDVKKSPPWIKTKKVYSESNDKYIDYLLCNDKATLIYMANLGCIEINPWNSTVKNPENPDWVVIDLDPEKIDFKQVVKTAVEVKRLMDELETECYCKTSGATGLHIYIPLAARYDYDTVKNFAHLVAHTINVRLPGITSIERMPAKRQHKVYVDFLQNRRGQTLAAPYSARPKPGATVSTPLEWKEVNDKLSPADFTIKNILKRIEKKGDLWKPVIGKGVNLNKILKKISDKEKIKK